jgi:hypothetical protein
MEALNIAIKKVVQDQGIYPRFNTDIERIRLFAELLDCDTRFPPIKVVRENGFFVLLDGQHRLKPIGRQERKEFRVKCGRSKKNTGDWQRPGLTTCRLNR